MIENIKNFVRSAVCRAAEVYRYYSDKRFTTVAGTLVYFFLMSLAPFLFWLSMFFGEVDLEKLASFAIFDAIMPFLKELQNSAGGATSGAGIILMVTTLYSSTNFFLSPSAQRRNYLRQQVQKGRHKAPSVLARSDCRNRRAHRRRRTCGSGGGAHLKPHNKYLSFRIYNLFRGSCDGNRCRHAFEYIHLPV